MGAVRPTRDPASTLILNTMTREYPNLGITEEALEYFVRSIQNETRPQRRQELINNALGRLFNETNQGARLVSRDDVADVLRSMQHLGSMFMDMGGITTDTSEARLRPKNDMASTIRGIERQLLSTRNKLIMLMQDYPGAQLNGLEAKRALDAIVRELRDRMDFVV